MIKKVKYPEKPKEYAYKVERKFLWLPFKISSSTGYEVRWLCWANIRYRNIRIGRYIGYMGYYEYIFGWVAEEFVETFPENPTK